MKQHFFYQNTEPIVKSINEYSPGETFEQFVLKKFIPFSNKDITTLKNQLKLGSAKSRLNLKKISKAIIGVSKKKIEEFEKADIQMKTIKLEKTGTLKESMSFAQIQYKEIIDEEWEESYWYETLTKRFFFIIFQKNNSNELIFKKAMFWTMPVKDLEIAKSFWEDTQEKVRANNFDSFIKISDNKMCHIRPKGKNSLDLMETISGTKEKKKSYWLNSSYIKKIIS